MHHKESSKGLAYPQAKHGPCDASRFLPSEWEPGPVSLRAFMLQVFSAKQGRRSACRSPLRAGTLAVGFHTPAVSLEDWRNALHLLETMQTRRLLEEVSICAAMSMCTRCAQGAQIELPRGSLPGWPGPATGQLAWPFSPDWFSTWIRTRSPSALPWLLAAAGLNGQPLLVRLELKVCADSDAHRARPCCC